MQTSQLILIICTSILCVASTVTFSSENEAAWDFYVQSIDPYGSDKESSIAVKTTQKSKNSSPVTTPNDTNSSPKEISKRNRQLQVSAVENQKIELEKLFAPLKKEPATDIASSNISNQYSNSVNLSSDNTKGYSEKSTKFRWGGKSSIYEYADYEFVFESANMEHIKKLGDTMTSMSKAQWEVDLNRTFQKIEQSINSTTAITTNQMRFRRLK